MIQTIDESMVLLDELEALASSANETVANAEDTSEPLSRR